MKAKLKISDYPNMWGSLASGLCLSHCVATPFLFAVHTGHVTGHHSHPMWWGLIDLLFIIISFIAVFWSSHHTTKPWMKYSLWISWTLLTMVILNEKLGFFHIAEEAIYIPSVALIFLHLLNRRYCRCKSEDCCI